MRVLFTALASSGHYHPIVPLARALQGGGAARADRPREAAAGGWLTGAEGGGG